ncbi:MAG: hypothetical protein JRF71_11805 [Deltaproteobacteria bacterium]|nr:hypothetical protein [Deltaproteobacteria bacterium]
MIRSFAILSIVLFSVSCATYAEDIANDTGAISGRIFPKDASVRIIAKTAGTEYKIKGNIKGEVTLTQGGDFTIKGLLPGKYDLLFFLQGKSKKKYFATRWSEVVVQSGKTTSGINYRLTPLSSKYLIDEILVAFKEETKAEEARKVIRAAGCVIKDTPLHLGTTIYTLDIPDDKSIDEMIKVFKKDKCVAYAEPNGISRIDAK